MSKTNEEKRRNHALKNEQVCNFLNETGEHPDWVITTAFYSALHFVRYKAFPIEINGSTFSTFDEYHSIESRNANYGKSPHDILRKLLNNNFRNIAGAYSELFDDCRNARYIDYDVRPEDVQRALENLEEIKKFCNTNKPKRKRPRIKVRKEKK